MLKKMIAILAFFFGHSVTVAFRSIEIVYEVKQLVKKVPIVSTFLHNTNYQDACDRINYCARSNK
ncbi:MAG: hypothetical protein QNJ18_00615 [Xenococcaceae cyanobacterium MO_167.B52]|nr:hypothetical protein [Xenococcaceae cyanobacterium MO_167.B52]